jgi:hypothetical protein
MRSSPTYLSATFVLATLATTSIDCGSEVGTGSGGSMSAPACDPSTPCLTGDHCVYPDQQCGKAKRGTCEKATPSCNTDPDQALACGCSGHIAPKSCIDASEDWTNPSVCANGTFTCGTTSCQKFTEYCVVTSGGPAPGSTSYACKPASAQCTYGIADCTCITEPGGDCAATGDYLITVSLNVP